MYWAVTTITTVGFGDITGSNNLERVFCAVMMIIGVILFSFASGALASILQNYDNSNALYQEKMVVLNKIYKEFKLPLELFIKIKKSMGYESKKDMHDLHSFLNELPYKLKTELSLYVYEQRYMKIKYFKNKTIQFIMWMCPLLKPQVYTKDQYLFMEMESVSEIFFLIHGLAAFVLPRYKNTGYIYIKEGDHFGVIDIVGSCQTQNINILDWYKKKTLLYRQFSVQSRSSKCEILLLSIATLAQMEQEFCDYFDQLFSSSIRVLRNCWEAKLDAMEQCQQII